MISVPDLSISGDYTIEWGASTGAGIRYELFEADNAVFANAAKLYDDCGLQRPITGKPDGTYYYRVRACDATTPRCGPHRPGANSILVDRPPVPGVFSENAARSIAARILDWRDPYDSFGSQGAERNEYRRANRAIVPRNVPFETVSELRLVLGAEQVSETLPPP